MSPVCDFSSVCPRTNTQRLLKATLRAAAAVAAAASQSQALEEAEEGTLCTSADGGTGCGVEASCAGLCTESDGNPGRCDTAHSSTVTTATTSSAALMATTGTASAAASSTFKCPRCPRAYALSYTLERHMKYECGVAKQFGCFKCGKRFSRKDILKAHISNTKSHCAAAAAAAAAAFASDFESGA